MGKRLSSHFNEDEFRCHAADGSPCPHCGGQVVVHPVLIDVLEDMRAYAGIPIQITSGYRCVKHNQEVGGKPSSAHLLGEAADIWVSGDIDRFKLVEAAVMSMVKRFGVGKDLIHVDISTTLPQDVCWMYGAGE